MTPPLQLNVVEFQSGSEKYQDIVEQEKLRLPNNRLAILHSCPLLPLISSFFLSPPLSKLDPLLSKNFDVPEDLQD